MQNKIDVLSQKMKQKKKEMNYRREMIRNLKYQFRRSNTQTVIHRVKERNYQQNNIIS